MPNPAHRSPPPAVVGAAAALFSMTLLVTVVGYLLVGPAAARDDANSGGVVTGPVDRLPPRPLEVERVDDAPEGEITLGPAVVWLDLDVDRAGQPELTLVNGGEGPIDLSLDAAPVAVADHGTPVPIPAGSDAADGALPDASGWVVLAEDEVHLDPGERARLWPTVVVPPEAGEGTYLAALRARAPEGQTPVTVVSFLAVSVDAPSARPPSLDIVFEQRGAAAVAEVGVSGSEALDAVRGQLAIRGWWGSTVAQEELPALLLAPDAPRTVAIEVTTPWMPGRYTAEVTVVGRAGDEVTASDTAWLWRWEAAVGFAGLLLVVSFTVLARTVLRRGRRANIGDG